MEPRGWGPHFKSSMPFPLGESYKGAKEVDNVCLISNSVYRIDKLCCEQKVPFRVPKHSLEEETAFIPAAVVLVGNAGTISLEVQEKQFITVIHEVRYYPRRSMSKCTFF